MLLGRVISELYRLCPGGVRRDVPLAQVSRWRIGGRADLIVEPGSTEELCALRAFIAREGLPSVVIGETSNLLFSDEGLQAICIRCGPRMSEVSVDGCVVTSEAGVWIPYLARRIMQGCLTGAEHTSGIPGTLGGLICMNGGSQRKGIGDAVVSVTAITPGGFELTYDHESCGFGYRQSVFQNNSTVVAAAKMRFERAPNRGVIRREMLSILRERSRKFPRKQPNCGSVFRSNPAMYSEVGPPGTVIERLGFKGYKIGDAQVSLHHANFFINAGTASSKDMLQLILAVRDVVHATTGYWMEPEVQFVTSVGEVVPISDRGIVNLA